MNAYQAFTGVCRGATTTLFYVNFDDVGALVTDNLIGGTLVLMAGPHVEWYLVDAGTQIAAGISTANIAEHALNG